MKRIEFYSKNINVSEDDKGNLLIDFVLCDFNTNANGKKIKREGAEDRINSLVNMPLVGRLKTENGVTDFTGHNQKKKYIKENNELYVKTYLDTEAVGTFLASQIREIDGVDYICGQALLWGRFENAKNIILERFSNNDEIKSSWELVITDSHTELENDKKIEVIDDFYFIGNCLLGSNVAPAYKCAGVQELQVAEEVDCDFEDELSSAIAQDIDNISKGGNGMAEENQVQGEENVEVSSLSIGDIRKKVSQLAWELEKEEDFWLYDSIIYPLENTAYFKKCGCEQLEDDYLKVVYSVDETNEINIVSKEDVKMTFVPKNNVVDISEFKKVETELSEKVESIVRLGDTIQEKETILSEKEKEISELQVFKEQVAEIQRIEAEKELTRKRENCKNTVISSKYLTEKDIETSEELKQAIQDCDENKIKIFIAEAVLKANLKEINNEVEVSEVEIDTITEPHIDLNSMNRYDYAQESSNPILKAIRNKKRR